MASVTAQADDSPVGPPPRPTPEEMQASLNASNSAIYEAELTDPEAAEELPHENLDRGQALDLMQSVFEPVLQAPAGIFDELEVERFLSDNAAIIAPGDLPSPPTGATVGAPPSQRYEGATLLESTLPLRIEGDSGHQEAIDLELEHAEGEVQPSNPLVEVGIPMQLGEGIDLPEVGIQVNLADAPTDRAPSTIVDSVAAYPDVAQDTSMAVAPTPRGVETLTLLQAPDAPTSQTFNLSLPSGAVLGSTLQGGAEVSKGGTPLLGVSPPTALDASGKEVPVTLSTSGTSVTLEVSPDASTTWPVMVDPLIETYNWWNNITGLGGWKSHTNASPNYYTADHATCTSYASPYACQAGLTANAPGLYIGALPGAVPINSTVDWEFPVPRWQEEWTNHNRAPDSFITSMTLEHVGFWHRTDSAPNPQLWTGIWNSATPGWVQGYSKGGDTPDSNANAYLYFNAGQNTEGKIGAFDVSNLDGHNLSAFRDAFVDTAIITIGDNKAPTMGLANGPSKWLNQIPTEPITVTASDSGLGISQLTPIAEGVSPPKWPPLKNVGCTGTTVWPCPGTTNFSLTRHEVGNGEVRDYDPSVMPQGIDKVTLYAEDPLGNKSGGAKAEVKVDHTAPSLAASGTVTEQAKTGANTAQYTLKYSAADGDAAAASAQTPFGGAGTGEGKTQRPMGTAVDSSGNVWVVDRENNRVEKFDETGKFLMQFGKPGAGDGEFNDPRAIAISSTGTVWVSDLGNHRVQAFNSEGKFVRKITNANFSEPYGVATGPGGVLWVSDSGSDKLFEFNESGAFIRYGYGSASNPTGAIELNAAVGLATDPAGNVWLVDNGYNRVQEYDSSGKYVLQFGSTGTGNGQFTTPVGIAIARSGNLLVADGGNNRVQVFQSNGVYLRQFGSVGTGNSQFTEPRGIAVNAEGTAFIGDAGNHRVSKWTHADLDRESGVASVEMKVDGQPAKINAPGCATENCPLTGEWTLKANEYSSGQHTVKVTATDGAGNSTPPKEYTITTDATAPQLTANSPFFTAPSGWLEQRSYIYAASASDSSGSGVTSLALKIDGKVVKSTEQGCPNKACSASIAATINMATYKGGAHPAELIATDVAGNTAKKAWTINVDPKGTISATEARETLAAMEATSGAKIVGPSTEVESGGPENSLELESVPPEIVVSGGMTPTTISADGENVVTMESPTHDSSQSLPPVEEGNSGFPTGEEPIESNAERLEDAEVTEIGSEYTPVEVTPTAVGEGATTTQIAGPSAAVTANTATSVDTVTRPLYDGAMQFEAIRSSEMSGTYSWELPLHAGQTLKLLDSKHAEVYFSDETAALEIAAEQAHDATGKEVSTSLSVSEGNVVTLHVNHQQGDSEGHPYVYPIVAGAGFQMGFEYTIAIFPPPPPEGGGEEEAGITENFEISAPEPATAAEAEISGLPNYLKYEGRIQHRHFRWFDCEYRFDPPDVRLIHSAGDCGNPFKNNPGFELNVVNWGMRGNYYIVPGAWVKHRGGPTDNIECDKMLIDRSGEHQMPPPNECKWWGASPDGGGSFQEMGKHITPYGSWVWAEKVLGAHPYWHWYEEHMAIYLWAAGHVGKHKTSCIDCS